MERGDSETLYDSREELEKSRKGKERILSPEVPHPSELGPEEPEVEVEGDGEVEKEDAVEPEPTDTNPNRYVTSPSVSLNDIG